ncbi:ABC transporter ATP-binding protein [Natrarchaeobius chitinivorans]|uniref:ABC transporter ATP-binding protein n=1 Tax=Natrarchaeobius chitinivorans TaxID=1679083 RepID=A0A3N6P385_NATCH|nr:ABC transporter ATP-binding protein [Natrarchaeobius chitinivorans]RQG89715.1 ABC transporter ATP-binding protein [Natrarchaeobius chitinivorans]
MLEVADVTKQFGNLTAVDEVSFEIGSGEIVGLLGPNGAGKTTLFNCVNGVYTPDGGEVRMNGVSLSDKPVNEICKLGIGRSFQIVRTFNNTTVLDNVTTGALFGRDGESMSRTQAREEAYEYIEFVGLEEEANTLTKNLTIANRRNVELARALATDPDLILLDEVASGLNPAEIGEMSDKIVQLRDEYDVSVFWIEHIMEAIMSNVDRIIVLHHGAKIADGTVEEIKANDEVSAAYFGEEV